jgi:hypothetical protein
MVPEGSLPCSQEPSTGPYPEPDQSNPYYPILSYALKENEVGPKKWCNIGQWLRKNKMNPFSNSIEAIQNLFSCFNCTFLLK